MLSATRIRNIKMLGIIASVATALSAAVAGDWVTAIGILTASMSSPSVFAGTNASATARPGEV